MHIIQGQNDTGTSARQMEMYEARMKALGKNIGIVWFDAGHGLPVAEHLIAFQEQQLRFAYEVLKI